MEIFLRLLLGHLIADFTLQTNFIAAWKRRNWVGLLVHCAIHPILYAIFLWNYLSQSWMQLGPLVLNGWACIFFIFVTHFIEDEWRIWSVLKRNAPDNTFFYFWDQVIHYGMIFVFSPTIEGSVSKFGLLKFPAIGGIQPLANLEHASLWQRFTVITQPEPWVWIGLCLAYITHFMTITIYFFEKDLWQKDFPNAWEKYVPMIERLLIVSILQLPFVGWILLPLPAFLRWKMLRWKGNPPLTWLNILFGTLSAVLTGGALRWIIHSVV